MEQINVYGKSARLTAERKRDDDEDDDVDPCLKRNYNVSH
jgi:hypothetical protein